MLFSKPLVYLFCIVRSGARLEGSEVAAKVGAVEIGPRRTLTIGDLSAIVSDLQLPQDTVLETLLQDPEQAEEFVLHHHRVLEDLAARTTVLPLRFGSLFSDDDSVREAIRNGRGRILRSIEDIEGAAEWGLKVFCDRARLSERLRRDKPEIAGLQTEVVRASEGKRFFLERRLERLLDDEAGHAILRCLDHTGQRLEPLCKHHTKGKIQPARLHGQGSEMVSNGAFLINRGREDGFFRAIDDLRRAYAGFGFDFECTGPWPAYSFVDGKIRENGNAA